VTASGVVEFQQILMDVDDSDAGRARAIARKLVQDFIQDQDGRMKHVDPSNRIDVFAYDDPTPATLHRPQTRTNVVASAFLGLLVGLALVYLLETQAGPVKNLQEVDRRSGRRVVGNAPAAG
jgi:capsular polysaccharide biosynthesis protein